jgi:hypothetical protein
VSRLRTTLVSLTAGAIALTAGAATAAATPVPTPLPSAIVGHLGYEGGAYPGGFHPTAGTVEVEFNLQPLVLIDRVGPSGKFVIPLGPGSYTLIGCGPSSSTGGIGLCGRPVSVTLHAGEVDHVRLVWALVP